MDRGYVKNNFIDDDINNSKEKNQALDNLNRLKIEIGDTTAVAELMVLVSSFLSENEIPEEIRKEIVDTCNQFDEMIDVKIAKSKLEECLKKFEIETEENDKSIDNYQSLSDDDVVVEGPKDDIFIDDLNDSKIDNSKLFEVNNDGTVQVNGNFNDKNSMNFAIMMTMSLLVANDSKIKPNLDMKFIKNDDKDKFKIIYGNFPIINHPDNRLNSELVSNITKLSNTYKSQVNYMNLLEKTSPEIKEAMVIIYNYVLNREGSFQMAIRDNGKKHDMAFGMDDNYSDIIDAFNINGAYVSYDSNERAIITVNETLPGNQLLILNTTHETLGFNLEEEFNTSLVSDNQYVKKMDKKEAANVNFVVLIILAIVETLIIAGYFIFVGNK